MIKGDFRGLAESEDGELITLEIVQDKHFVRLVLIYYIFIKNLILR
jgi:hypothetical protein